MSNEKFKSIPEDVYQYILKVGNRISDVKEELIKETYQRFPEHCVMVTERTQGELLKMLVQLSNSKRGIEIGVFTGYSSICIAEGLPKDGKLTCLDISKEFTDLARKYWEKAGVSDRIELILGSGTDSLEGFLKVDENVGGFDFAYVDADKPNYLVYHELLLKLLRPGGFIVYDNTLWGYKVCRPSSEEDLLTNSLKNLNSFLQKDQRVEICQLHIGDGMTLVRKI